MDPLVPFRPFPSRVFLFVRFVPILARSLPSLSRVRSATVCRVPDVRIASCRSFADLRSIGQLLPFYPTWFRRCFPSVLPCHRDGDRFDPGKDRVRPAGDARVPGRGRNPLFPRKVNRQLWRTWARVGPWEFGARRCTEERGREECVRCIQGVVPETLLAIIMPTWHGGSSIPSTAAVERAAVLVGGDDLHDPSLREETPWNGSCTSLLHPLGPRL